MGKNYRLNAAQLEAFRVISAISAEQFRQVLDRLRQFAPAPIKPEKLFSAAAEIIGNDEAIGSLIGQALIAHGWMRENGTTIEQVLGGVRGHVQANWKEEEAVAWLQKESLFRELLDLPVTRLAASVIDLSFDHANLMRGSRILTDIRPIYDGEATVIEAAVISHTLRLRYESLDGHHELNISMDESDIMELSRQCERALRKAKMAHELMVHKANVPTIITGEDDDA